MTVKSEQIRALNDDLRRHLSQRSELAFITAGVAGLGPQTVDRIVKTVGTYDDFCHANAPYDEHDFGSFDVEGQIIFFKIDYYDRTLKCGSPDPSDASLTRRVITIMLAEEY